MAVQTKVRPTATDTPRKAVIIPLKATDTILVGDGVVTATRPVYVIHRLAEACKNEASSWYVVPNDAKHIKWLASKDTKRKAKGMQVRPRIITGEYILLGGKARHHHQANGTTPENVYKQYLTLKQEQLFWQKAAAAHSDSLVA